MNERQWLRHLLPLPRQISLEGAVETHPGAVDIVVNPGAGPQAEQAADELRSLLATDALPGDARRFRIVLGITDDKDRLQELPNNEQAYLVEPTEPDRLAISALDSRGLYYGARTLHQLLQATLDGDRVTVPLARILDWPALQERGLWNFPDEAEWIPWLASLKLNYGKMAATRLAPIERGTPNSAVIEQELMLASRRRAFSYIPFILHLNFLHDCGLYRAYPALAGKGDGALTGRYFAHKQGNQHRAPCAAQPVLVDILQEWMESIAAQEADEISCWLSERPGQCGCNDCTATGQFVLEARAFVKAWRRAQKKYPDLQIRLFLSTTTLERDYRVLDELPTEAKIERACASGLERVSHRPRDLFANPLYERYAEAGRWIASYDVPIGANGDVDTPEYKVPARSAHRVRDYVGQLRRRGYRAAYGMIAWGTQAKETDGFNIAALAEWAWNPEGRDTAEFATAWAVREGVEKPEQVAEWAELTGPLIFDVFDSDFPVCYSQDKALKMVQRRLRPYLGEGMFRYYPTPASFDEKKAVCARALQTAEGLPSEFAAETRVLLGYIDLAHAVWQVAELLATSSLEKPEDQDSMRVLLKNLRRAGNDNVAAVKDWRAGLGPAPWHQRVHDAIAGSERTVAEISRFVEERYLY